MLCDLSFHLARVHVDSKLVRAGSTHDGNIRLIKPITFLLELKDLCVHGLLNLCHNFRELIHRILQFILKR